MSTAFIVDDHKDTAETLAHYFRQQDFQTATYNEFENAYAAISQDHPGVVVLDLAAAGRMDASEFIRKTRQDFPNLPLIILSDDPKAKTVAVSVNGCFLLKPISPEEIAGGLRELMPRILTRQSATRRLKRPEL